LSGDCQAFAEGELVSRGTYVEYDIEDLDGELLRFTFLTSRNLRTMPPVQFGEDGPREVDLNTLSAQVHQESTAGTGYAVVEIDLI